MKKTYFISLIIMAFIVTPVFSQKTATPEKSSLKGAELWLWTFDCKVVFPNPCYPTTGWVKARMELFAMDTNARTYSIDVKSEIYNLAGEQRILTFHGNIPPTKEIDLTVIPDTSVLPPGTYLVVLTGSCPQLGKEDKITKRVVLL